MLRLSTGLFSACLVGTINTADLSESSQKCSAGRLCLCLATRLLLMCPSASPTTLLLLILSLFLYVLHPRFSILPCVSPFHSLFCSQCCKNISGGKSLIFLGSPGCGGRKEEDIMVGYTGRGDRWKPTVASCRGRLCSLVVMSRN